MAIVGVVAVLAVGAGVASASNLRIGSTRYVRVVRLRYGGEILGLTKAGHRRFHSYLRGRILDARCVRVVSVQGDLVATSESTSLGTIRGPHGHMETVSFVDPRASYCDVGLDTIRTGKHSTTVRSLTKPILDSVALDRRGAVYLDDDRITATLLLLVDEAQLFAFVGPSRHFPSAAWLAKLVPNTVVLRSAHSRPPGDNAGCFSNRRNHVRAVERAANGQLLFIDLDRGVFSTNVEAHISRLQTNQISLAREFG